MPADPLITGTDFVSMATDNLDASVAFYGETLGLHRSVYAPDHHYAEFETGNLTLSVHDPVKMGVGPFTPNKNAVALRVNDTHEARAALEAKGVTFFAPTLDTSVCHMAFFADPAGNALMLHHRYAPRHPPEG